MGIFLAQVAQVELLVHLTANQVGLAVVAPVGQALHRYQVQVAADLAVAAAVEEVGAAVV
jgi:hypothetical protein